MQNINFLYKRLHQRGILLPFYFHEHFPVMPQLCAYHKTSVACNKIALEWDEAFKNMNDPSGRAVAVCMMMRM
jgi:hypothetical protein